MEGIEIERFGPKMSALKDRERRYVLAMLSDPLGNPTVWARAAGYSDHKHRCKVYGHYLCRDERIKEAAQEEARRHLDTIGPILGIGVMMQIARTKGHKSQLAAAQALADRAGFHAKSEHNVNVVQTDLTGSAMMKRIEDLARSLGVDAGKLLGTNAVEPPVKLIEGEVVK